jgi:hypothetical protein
MAKQTVLLLGATGETGGDILAGLIEDGNFVSGWFLYSRWIKRYCMERAIVTALWLLTCAFLTTDTT